MISSMAFASSAEPCAMDIISSNACRVGASISETTVQYCSAETSVMMRMAGIPVFSPIFDSALNLSTIARTLPGLQYMMSRTIYIGPSRNGGGDASERSECPRPEIDVKRRGAVWSRRPDLQLKETVDNIAGNDRSSSCPSRLGAPAGIGARQGGSVRRGAPRVAQ